MTEDKQAIEAIAKMFPLEPNESPTFIATQILMRLASLGYVKLVEQKLPEYINCTTKLHELLKAVCIEAQQDMLSVDSEGCKWVRVFVGGKGK